jgi:hypothetical protein
MAKTVTTTFRLNLPIGSGRNVDGSVSNDKVIVAGQIAITDYVAGGEPLRPHDLGLSTIDYLGLDVRSVNDAVTEPNEDAMFLVGYDDVLQTLIINVDHGGDTPVTTDEAANVRFLAIGSAATANLT